MTVATTRYNPGFLADDQLIASFCVRTNEFQSMVEVLRECAGNANTHQIVIGPRGSGKTILLLRIVAEIRRDEELSSQFFPVVFSEESYEVSTIGEFWLECLSRLADQMPHGEDNPDLHLTYDELRQIHDDRTLGERCLGVLQDFADREDKRLVLVVENLNMLLGDIGHEDTGWQLRHVLQTDPRIVLLASATSRFDEIDNPDKALYDLFRRLSLHPLDRDDSMILWQAVSGQHRVPEKIQALRILTGGNPHLLTIVARFGANLSFHELMGDLLHLVDEHTEYFKGHLDRLPAQERKVYLALAQLWKPATAREIADRARLDINRCSANLKRLTERGGVEVAGGTDRRKLYYVSERLYNIYYLMRRARGRASLVEALVCFMEAQYSPSELRDFFIRRFGTSDQTVLQHGSESAQRKIAELHLGMELVDASVATMNRLGDQESPELPEIQCHGHLIRAHEHFLGRDEAACMLDIESALSLLSSINSLPRGILDSLYWLAVELGAVRLRELIVASPASDMLLPFTTALERELGLESRVAREVEEVAEDVKRDLEEQRKVMGRYGHTTRTGTGWVNIS